MEINKRMKQKMEFEKNIKEGKLIIRECSEVDPGVIMPLIQEEYDLNLITKASSEGFNAFRQRLRTRSFFPNIKCVEKIFGETREYFAGDDIAITITYDDNEGIPKEEIYFNDDIVELDHLLAEDGEASEDELKEIDDVADDPLRYSPEDISESEN
jgi:hypothetical protein